MGHRQAPAERENKEGWGPFWRWIFAALFFWLAASFFGKAEASVLGHDSLESCENAMAAIAAGNAPHGTAYLTEKDFYALSHQPYYLKDGECYQTNDELKEMVEWIEVATATTAGGTGIYMGARMAAASGVVKAVKRAVAAVMGSILAGVIAEHKDWPNPIEILASLNGRTVATIWKNPCLGVTLGQNAGLPAGQILRHCEQVVPPTGDIEDGERILAPRSDPASSDSSKEARAMEIAKLEKEAKDAGLTENGIEAVWTEAEEAAKKEGNTTDQRVFEIFKEKIVALIEALRAIPDEFDSPDYPDDQIPLPRRPKPPRD